MITEILPTLQIHKLTQEQYDRELEAGRINENALYLTPSMSQTIPTLASGTDLNTVRTFGDYYLSPENTYKNCFIDGITGILRVTPGYSLGGIHQIIEVGYEKFERTYCDGIWEKWKSSGVGGSEGLLVAPVDAGYMVMQWGRTSMTVKAGAVSSVQVNLPHAYKNVYDYEIFAHVYHKRPEIMNCGCYDQKVGSFKVYCSSNMSGDATGYVGWMTVGYMEKDPRYTI